MRIAYLTSQYPAPSHTFIMREVEALRARGLDIDTFSIRQPSDREILTARDRAAHENTWYVLPASLSRLLGALIWVSTSHPVGAIRVFGLALRHRPPGMKSLLYALFYWIEAVMLARELAKRKIDCLHNHFANPAAIVGLLVTRLLEIPWSLTLHGISEFDYPAGLLLREKITAARFIACVSYFGMAQAYRISNPAQWEKMEVVRCGLDLSNLPPDKSRIARSRPRIVCVGRLSAEKGHAGLLRAFARQREAGMNAELDLIGDGPERENLEKEIERLGIGDDCRLMGLMSSDEVLREVGDSDLFVMASFMEGLPIVLMEALALGVAVVAPRVAGIPELVDDSCGMMFAPGDWNGLGEALAEMIADPKRRQQCGVVGKQRIHDQFDISKTVEPLVSRFQA